MVTRPRFYEASSTYHMFQPPTTTPNAIHLSMALGAGNRSNGEHYRVQGQCMDLFIRVHSKLSALYISPSLADLWVAKKCATYGSQAAS